MSFFIAFAYRLQHQVRHDAIVLLKMSLLNVEMKYPIAVPSLKMAAINSVVTQVYRVLSSKDYLRNVCILNAKTSTNPVPQCLKYLKATLPTELCRRIQDKLMFYLGSE